MNSVSAELATAKPNRQRHLDAAQRIKQLIRRHREEREQLLGQVEHMQRIAAQMIPLLPGPVVTRILESAKEGETNVRR